MTKIEKQSFTLLDLESFIGYTFENKSLLEQAFTHKSHANESKNAKSIHNERLEFLGDAVLELITTDYLYKNFPDLDEGELTSLRSALVRGDHLSTVARQNFFPQLLRLSQGERRSGGSEKNALLANAVEAFIGALYLDGGINIAKEYIQNYILPYIQVILEGSLHKDPKSILQEVIQESLGVTPHYEVVSAIGPDHERTFAMRVYAGKILLGEGVGPSKQSAQIDAARIALLAQETSNF